MSTVATRRLSKELLEIERNGTPTGPSLFLLSFSDVLSVPQHNPDVSPRSI